MHIYYLRMQENAIEEARKNACHCPLGTGGISRSASLPACGIILSIVLPCAPCIPHTGLSLHASRVCIPKHSIYLGRTKYDGIIRRFPYACMRSLFVAQLLTGQGSAFNTPIARRGGHFWMKLERAH